MDPCHSEPTRGSSLERSCAFLALVAPFAVTALRASAASDWRGDVAALTGLGVLPVGTEGWLGLVGAQAAALLPIGGRWLRAVWLGAFATAIASRLIYGMARRLLGANAPTPYLAPPLALAAALTAVLSPTFQVEGTALGGAAPAAAAALAALTAYVALPSRDVRSGLVVGALGALTLVESHAAALSLLAALAARALTRRRRPDARELFGMLGGSFAILALVLAAFALRAGSPHAWLDLGFGIGRSSLANLNPSLLRSTAFSAWFSDVGLVAFGLSLAGAGFGMARPATRPLLFPLLALAVVDLAFPAEPLGALVRDASAPARLLAVSALATLGALGVQGAALALARARLPFARPAAVLLVAFDFTLVFVGAEMSAAAAERRDGVATEVWTDEALSSLPSNGLFLARSEAIAFRLWAAQVVRGERPDIVVVPSTLLERGGLRRRLLATEPALAPLLRDIALGGQPGEFALSTLADARPLFVELDAGWDQRLAEHVVPASFWLRFRAHPVGRSDRNAAFQRSGRRLERVSKSVLEREGSEDSSATRAVLVASLRQRALMLARQRDRETALETALALRRLEPHDEVAREIERRLAVEPATACVP